MRSLWVLSVLLLAVPAWSQEANADADWWKTAVFYQIYPRSFQDSDGDGVGDLPGVTSRLEYLKTLGVSAIWLSPIFTSPMADFGYDVADFYNIDPIFGTLVDFDAMIVKANEVGIKVILDFVPNHSSDESEWFIKSVARDPEYEDYYVWFDPVGINETGHPIPPNSWIGSFSEPVWTYVEERGQFYYHRYNYKQPDLNYKNEKVVQQMEDVLTFWLKRGATGFRVDTVHTLYEASFPDVPSEDQFAYCDNQPETYEIVFSWRRLLDAFNKTDNFTRVMMTEAWGSTHDVMAYYGTEENPGAHFTFNFHFIWLSNTSTAQDFKNTIDGWMTDMPSFGTANWVIGNHDQYRVATRYGPDVAAGIAMLSLLLPGVGIVYNGEEIGMVNNMNISYEDTQDPAGVNAGPDGYLYASRDFERTPFQWDDTHMAGFTSGDTTWLPINKNYLELNLRAQQSATETTSFYHIYSQLMNARTFPTIKEGTLTTKVLAESVISILREKLNGIMFLVVVNLGGTRETVALKTAFPTLPPEIIVMSANPASGFRPHLLMSSDEVVLEPYASVVFIDMELPINGAMSAKSGLVAMLCLCLLTFRSYM